MKTNTWICDVCGGEITEADRGWVEWLLRTEGEKKIGRGLRLVHAWPHSPRKNEPRCQYDQAVERGEDGSTLLDGSLSEYVGAGGLMELLFMLSEHELPEDEVIEMIKRLHIPGYEHTRMHFNAAIAEQVFEPNTKPGFYKMADINATLAWLGKKRPE